MRRKALAALGALLAGFLVFTCSSLGLSAGFSFSVSWAQRLNRWEFERHEQGYRDMVARIAKDMAGSKPGTHQFYELSVTRDPSSLRRMEPPVPDARLDLLLQDGLLVEVHQYRGQFAVRFVTRPLSDGRTFNLVYWDPKPNDGCVWFQTDWWENEYIEWVDSQWWSTYCSREGHRPRIIQDRPIEEPQ